MRYHGQSNKIIWIITNNKRWVYDPIQSVLKVMSCSLSVLFSAYFLLLSFFFLFHFFLLSFFLSLFCSFCSFLSFCPSFFISFFLFLSFLFICLCLRQLCSLALDVIIFVWVSYCWHFNSGTPQSGLTQTARNHTSQPPLTAVLVASNFSQIKGLFYLAFFHSLPVLWENKPDCFPLICWLLVAFPVSPTLSFL